MSQLAASLSQAAQRNRELLSCLSQTDYATPALEQNLAYISELKAQIAATDKELKKLHQITEDERKDHLKYRDSTVKRFAFKLGGQKGQQKFSARQEKEEREFLEAWQKEREANERREELSKALSSAENSTQQLESDKARHEEAQRELDSMYQFIFSGPTPDLPQEDQMEWTVNQARDWFQQCQSKAGTEKRAMDALQQTNGSLAQAQRDMSDALSASTMDMWGGGTFTDMMERDALSRAQNSISQAQRYMNDACQAQPAIKPLGNVFIDQGHLMSDVFFDNIFTDMAQHDRIKNSDQQLRHAVSQLTIEIREQRQRASDSQSQLKQAAENLENVRQELQRIRAEAFERFAYANDPPPAY